jgi:hypothetical protein
MNAAIQKLADAEINRATAAMKDLVANAEGDQVVLAVIQYIGTTITTAVNKELVEMKGQQRVHKMVQNGKELLKQKPATPAPVPEVKPPQ